MYHCKICVGISYKQRGSLTNHMNKFHQINNESRSNSSATSSNIVVDSDIIGIENVNAVDYVEQRSLVKILESAIINQSSHCELLADEAVVKDCAKFTSFAEKEMKAIREANFNKLDKLSELRLTVDTWSDIEAQINRDFSNMESSRFERYKKEKLYAYQYSTVAADFENNPRIRALKIINSSCRKILEGRMNTRVKFSYRMAFSISIALILVSIISFLFGFTSMQMLEDFLLDLVKKIVG